MSSARVLDAEPSKEDDSMDRSTKKVKTKLGEEDDTRGKEIVMFDPVQPLPSYKERLLSAIG